MTRRLSLARSIRDQSEINPRLIPGHASGPQASRRLKSIRAPRSSNVKPARCDRFRGASMRFLTVRRLSAAIMRRSTAVVKSAGYDRLALFYADRGRLGEAIDLYQRMFQESPEGSVWSWHNYSVLQNLP